MRHRSAIVILAILATALPFAQPQERPTRRITVPGLIMAVAFSPDGAQIVGWDPAGWVAWDAESGRQSGREPIVAKTCGRMPTLPRSHDGRTIGASCGGRVLIFDVSSTEAVGEWKLAEKEAPILFTAAPDGSKLAVVIAGATGSLRVIDRGGTTPVATLTTPEEVEQAAFSPNARTIATGGITGLRLWTLPDGKESGRIEGGSSFAISPDGRTVAVARSKGPVIADAATGGISRELQGPSTILRFSQDGSRLAGLNNQQVVVWDARTGDRRLVLKTEEFISVALSPDGSRVVTVSRELRGSSVGSTIAVWRVPPPE